MFSQGQFINSAATTPEELARKRAEIAAMMPRFGNARYVGEGLGQLFMGIGLGRQQKALDGQEREGRASAQERLNAVMGGGIQGRAQPGGFSVLGTMPMEPVSAPDPASPEGIASDAMAALGRSTYTPGDRESFVKAMMPHALRVSQETGLDPRLVIAQAAQETGWGKSAPNNNYFGIKSHGKGGGGTFATTEFVNGQPITINDSFRGYGSMGESAADYARFLQENPRYRDMLAAPDLEGQIAALGASGYATDPNYANAVASIANSIQVPGMDAPPVGGMNSPQMTAATIPTDALMSIVMDQWQPPEVRAQAQTMLDQQTKVNDPAYRMGLRADELEIQKAEAELAQMNQPQTPAQLAERQALAAAGGLQPGTPEYNSYMLTGEMTQPGQGTEFGLQPIFGTDANGNVVVMQLGKDGTAVKTALPEGVTPDLAVKAAEAARGTAIGKSEAEAVTGLGGAIAKAEQAIGLIDQIANDGALESITGMFQGNIPAGTPLIGGGQAGVDLGVKIEQLQGKVFLEAFESLKGGGAITEIEGAKAEAAMARLNRAQSTEAYRAALDELKGIINNGMIRAQERAAKAGANTGGAPSGGKRMRFNPETGMVE